MSWPRTPVTRHRRDSIARMHRRESMILETEKELAYSCELIGKMYNQRESAKTEESWHPSTREDVALGIDSALQKIQREVYEYLKCKYEPQQEPSEAPQAMKRKKELV